MHGEAAERRGEKPGEPDTLALPMNPHSVHAVVPIAGSDEWKPVHARGGRAIERADAMLVECAGLVAPDRLLVGLLFIRCERSHAEVGYGRVPDRGVPRDLHVVIGDVG